MHIQQAYWSKPIHLCLPGLASCLLTSSLKPILCVIPKKQCISIWWKESSRRNRVRSGNTWKCRYSNCRDFLRASKVAYLVKYITKRHQPAITRNVSKSCQPNKVNSADLRRHNVDMTRKMYYWLFQWESTGIAHCPWTMITFNSHNELGNFYIPIQ